MSSGRGPTTKKVRPPKKCSAKEKEFKDDEDLVNNIGFFFNDDIPATESQGQMSTGAVSSSKKARRAKKRGNKRTHDKNIAGNADYTLTDDIPANKSDLQASCGKVLSKKTVSSQEYYQAGDDLTKNEKDTLNESSTSDLSALVPLQEDFSVERSQQADEQLAKDIEYILNDNPLAAEPNEAISSVLAAYRGPRLAALSLC